LGISLYKQEVWKPSWNAAQSCARAQGYVNHDLRACGCQKGWGFWVVDTWELLYADDLDVIAENEDDLIKRLNEWKDNMENRGMRVNMNETMVMISVEWQKVTQKAVRWPCSVCGTGIGNRVVLEKIQRAVKWLYVCVCVHVYVLIILPSTQYQ